MKPQKMKNLFLRQSYQDAWEEYEKSLTKKYFIRWDYVILTASNEEQAAAYQAQIDARLKQGRLPGHTVYKVLPDPEGKRVGSGGATFHVMKYISEQTEEEQCFRNKRILVIHSGGDSKRVPQYSACGKLFSPVPRELPDGRRSTLFDEFIIGMSGMPARFKEGMLVLSGDVLLLFNPLQVDVAFRGAAAVSVKEHVETGKDHGVFLSDSEGYVGNFLHKQSVDKLRSLGAVNEQGAVDLDTGAILLDCDLLESLFGLIGEKGRVVPEKYARFVNEKARISFYGDFLYPLASKSTLEQYMAEKAEGEICEELLTCRKAIWEAISSYSLKLLCLAPAQFIHFGTTRELLALLTEEIDNYEFLDWRGQIFGVEEHPGACAYSNSYIEKNTKIAASSYIEDSYIYEGTRIGEGCVIAAVTLRGEQIPSHTALHGLKQKDGTFVIRVYGVEDNPKVTLEENGAFLGSDLPAFIKTAGLKPEEVWKGETHDLWDAALYPVCRTIGEAVEAAVLILELAAGRPDRAEAYRKMRRISLKESFEQADIREIAAWQEKLNTQVRITRFLLALKERRSVSEAASAFGSQGVTEAQLEKLKGIAEDAEFGLRMRLYYYLSRMTKGHVSEELEDKCFRYICDSLYDASIGREPGEKQYHIAREEVKVELPVRVNFGGGWSDTPPYCNEHGGTVLNAAVKLNGILPVIVTVRRLDKPCIALASTDSGAYEEFTDVKRLQSCRDPFDTYALHKAALLACGIVPLTEEITMEELMKRLGGGLYLSTAVMGIPRGSGLGTSSILAGACVKAIFEYIGKEAAENELYTHVLCMEQLMSTGGGWQDQVGGLTAGIKLASTKPGLLQEIEVEHLKMPREAIEELKERFVLIYTGQRRLARNLLREVVGGYIGSNPNSIEVLYEIQRTAVLMKFELEKGNIDGFAELLERHWELSKRLDGGSTNTCIDQIFLSCQDLLAARMICGAGGGGFLQAILKKGCTKEELRTRIRSVFQDSGVDVWDCEIVF
ncbi:MAG: bifunctional fucokinase/L-fucose-1-P-guanylyltransferase [Lachnospiraceae bacterium]|nr:bifunctional fucokinase/L-fucose-1-P-guanylyltransferase [Lachnospiraceae bacterium]